MSLSRICRSCRSRFHKSSTFSSISTATRSLSTSTRLFQTNSEADNWEGLGWIATNDWIYEQLKPDLSAQCFFPWPVPDAQLQDEFIAAIVEVIAFIEAGVPLHLLDTQAVGKSVIFSIGDASIEDAGKATPLPINQIGNIKFLPIDQVVRLVLSQKSQKIKSQQGEATELNKEPVTQDTKVEDDPLTYPIYTRSTHDWAQYPLDSLEHRFAMIKRVMRRTGHRIPDCQIPHLSKPMHIWNKISERRPTTLAERIAQEEKLELSNVKIHKKPVTEIQDDVEKGRWRIICQELRARHLPEAELVSETDVDTSIKENLTPNVIRREWLKDYLPSYQWISERKHEKLVNARTFRIYKKRMADEEKRFANTKKWVR